VSAKSKLPVVGGGGGANVETTERVRPQKTSPDKGGGGGGGGAKSGKAKGGGGGWSAFTDGGTAPGWVTAARVVLLVAFAATVPTLLGVTHGNRIFWTIGIAVLPLFWIVGGYHLWRRICPLAVTSQLARLLGRPGTRKAGDWLAKNYLLVQLGLMIACLSFRLVATNGSAAWLAGFLGAITLAAIVTGVVYSGKTWCNLLCPIGLVEKIYTEPSRGAAPSTLTSQCAPCVACKKHCPDIDQEQGYWKEMSEPARRTAYFAWPGVVVGFYVYYWLVAGTWDYYFSGAWAYEVDQPSGWLAEGFHFVAGVPRVVAAPLTLVAFGLASWLVFAAIEAVFARRAVAALGTEPAPSDDKRAAARARIRHHMLAFAGFVGFNAFYFFAGQPSLRRLPPWAVTGFGAIVVFASAAIFFRRWRRNEDEYVQERFAQKILKKWEWGDAPPSDDLKDIYLLHTERTKARESRLRAYKETVRELVADGLVTRAELKILDSLRAQLGISDKDHAKIVGELSEEERQLFDPSYQGSVELRLQRQQYRRDLERVVMEAARAGLPPADAALEAVRGEHGVSAADHAAELEKVLAADGPVAALYREEVAAIERLGRAALATKDDAPRDGGQESASLSLLRHLAIGRARTHLLRALGLVGTLTRGADASAVAGAREAVAGAKTLSAAPVAELVRAVPGELLVPLVQAVERAATPAAMREVPSAPPILAVSDDGSPYLRAAAALLLSRFDDDASRARLAKALVDPEPIVREAAVRSLGARARLTRELLSTALADGDARVRSAAVRAVSGVSSGEVPAVDAGVLAQTTRGVGNAPGVYATLDANAIMASLTTIEKMMMLRLVPMFAELDPDDLEQLAERVEERRYEPGATLCVEGEAGDAVYLLVRGAVRVTTGSGADERVLSELGQGACIGEMAVFDQAPRSATVRATERVRALIVPGDGFKALLVERPEMNQVIIAELVRRMRGLMGRGGAGGSAVSTPATTIPR
jgi:hypothetical protein